MTFRTVSALLLVVALPAAAAAQTNRPNGGPKTPAMGENYGLEVAYAWWNPGVFGTLASDRLDLIGSKIDLVDDLGFGSTKIRDLKVQLRPARAHKFRFQYSPLEYQADGVLTREVTFAGNTFPASLPIASSLSWKVWRVGYEWDFITKSRGFVGVLFEARKTDISAALQSLIAEGSASASAPLPAIGVVARGYVLPDLALNFDFSGFKAPPIDDRYDGTYWDMDLSATVNITNNLGVSGGWRRLSTALRIERDTGNLEFKGFWFGGAVRY